MRSRSSTTARREFSSCCSASSAASSLADVETPMMDKDLYELPPAPADQPAERGAVEASLLDRLRRRRRS
jgi:hypothetical protein